jgi:long-chain acyl-CoA synthetase
MGGNAISYSKVAYNQGKKGETPVYRNPQIKEGDGLVDSLFDGDCTDLKTMFNSSFESFKENPFLGTREKVTEVEVDPETKEEKKVEKFGKYMYMTYGQVGECATSLAKAFYLKELTPKKEQEGRQIRIMGIYCRNREEWAITDIACVLGNITSIPLYDTLGDSSIEYIANQTEMESIACSGDKIAKLCQLKTAEKIPTLKAVISFDEVNDTQIEECKECGLELLHFYNLVEAGEGQDVELEDPTADDIFTICYTSGTTGNPKGVLSTHRNFVCTLGGANMIGVVAKEDDIHYSYLPLAHVFERMMHLCFALGGGRIGYYQGDISKIKDDLATLRPTYFASVPRLLNRFYDLMQAGINDLQGFKKTMADWAIGSKMNSLDTSGDNTSMLWDGLVFKKFRDILGGRVRMIITGSAPISKETMKFLKIAFSCKIYEAYGQTETTGASFATNPDDPEIGHVGGPTPHNEFKLVDVPDMDYLSTDTDEDGNSMPRGEICIRGPNCFAGYYMEPDKTAEAVDSDGWVHTGDIGAILPNGALRILDRKKNIFKLAQGEYIAAEKLENIFTQHELIKQIFVYGDSLQHFLVAIIVPDKEYFPKWAEQNGITDDFETAIQSETFSKAINDALVQKRKEHNLNGLEAPKKFHFATEEFTVENDMLTPTFKLKRNEAKKAYYDQIKEMYEGAKLQGE